MFFYLFMMSLYSIRGRCIWKVCPLSFLFKLTWQADEAWFLFYLEVSSTNAWSIASKPRVQDGILCMKKLRWPKRRPFFYLLFIFFYFMLSKDLLLKFFLFLLYLSRNSIVNDKYIACFILQALSKPPKSIKSDVSICFPEVNNQLK